MINLGLGKGKSFCGVSQFYCANDRLARITTLYQTLHDSIHAKSGQESGLKLQYIRTDTESVMGWVSFPTSLRFESFLLGAYVDNATLRAIRRIITTLTKECGGRRCELCC